MNAPLAIGQILVSIALIAAILLQARGTGLSGTFGGDSAVYRSRRGIEKRLWQRSEERRVGKECMVQCRSRWSPYH